MGSRRHLGARVRTQGAHEVRQLVMVLDATEARGGAEQAEAGPPVNHVARAPALHVAGDVPKGRDEVLDAVRGGEEGYGSLGRRSTIVGVPPSAVPNFAKSLTVVARRGFSDAA